MRALSDAMCMQLGAAPLTVRVLAKRPVRSAFELQRSSSCSPDEAIQATAFGFAQLHCLGNPGDLRRSTKTIGGALARGHPTCCDHPMNARSISRSTQLSTLLCAIAACGDDVIADDTHGATTGCEYPFEQPVMIAATDVANIDVVDGDYPLGSCEVFCDDYIYVLNALNACGPAPDVTTTGGDEGSEDTTAGTGGGATTGDPGEVTVICRMTSFDCGTPGRLSGALESKSCEGDNPWASVGTWFAAMAHAEAASVVSFVRLAATLAAHDAPAELVARSRAAARDEVRHARVMARHARARGVAPTRPRHAAFVLRGIEALACENAIEGCVHETWAAVLTLAHSGGCHDASLRAELDAIARDEVRHAELAWAIDEWVRTRLHADAIARVDAARAAAAGQVLARELHAQPAVAIELALPSPAATRRMAASLHAALWA
jgi:hypothetical protein